MLFRMYQPDIEVLNGQYELPGGENISPRDSSGDSSGMQLTHATLNFVLKTRSLQKSCRPRAVRYQPGAVTQ